MSRPLRIEFAGALYHVTSRGDGREDIYLDVLAKARERFNWTVHAYCLMGNHYHLLLETPDGNLSKGMRYLNGVYTQRFTGNTSMSCMCSRSATRPSSCRGRVICWSLPVTSC